MCLCLMALLLFHGGSVAKPNRLLKGVTIIEYWVAVEETRFGEDCRVNKDSLTTALRFVANQSTKLKVIPRDEAERRADELIATKEKIFKELSPSGKWEDMARVMQNDRYVAAKKAADEYIKPPSLGFDIKPVEVSGACVGGVEAEVSAWFDTTKMYHTGATKYEPRIPIWSDSYVVKGPRQRFTNQVTEVAEELMKALVNDWTDSQDLPE